MAGSDFDSTVAAAFRSLVLVEDGWSERGAMRRAMKEGPGRQDRREVFRLVMDTLTRKSLIDHVILSVLGRVPAKKDRLNIARLTVVLFLLSDSGNKREALQALRAMCPVPFRDRLESLVGHVVARDRIGSYLDGLNERQRVALVLGYPEWWVEYCIQVWGRDQALQLLDNANRIRPRYLHVNPLRLNGTPTQELSSLPGLEAVDSQPGFFRVLTEGLPGPVREYVDKGILEGQDLASYLAVKAGDPAVTDTVLDVCAAPGGKTGALSQLMENKGSIISVDYSLGRIRDWKRMVSMLGVENASGMVEDATRPALRDEAIFDLILVDPPCSGSGIFERNPSMKWHLSPQRLSRYAELQYHILEESSRLLKPDGRIIYSTCSISLEENESVISRFISTNPDYETRPILENLGHPGLRGFGNCRRFYPHLDKTSGYFIARLERTR